MLYIVATPIGNLKDITLRALEVLRSVDLIAAEDTRHTKILLGHYQVTKPLTSYHAYNKLSKGNYLLGLLKMGKDIALVSDSGTPGISDPGYHLIRLVRENGLSFTVIPGPCALINGLILSGLPPHKFTFEGFLSSKKGPRRKRLKLLVGQGRTIVLYESAHRLVKLLEDIKDVLTDVPIACIREMTKKFEEVRYGNPKEILEHFKIHRPRGEFVVVLRPFKKG